MAMLYERGGIVQELEKILEEIDEYIYTYKIPPFGMEVEGTVELLQKCKDIIRKHMNDDWIPVERELPPLGERLQAIILHHEWISDYDSNWVPEEEKILHPEWTEVCEIMSTKDGTWNYIDRDCGESEACINPQKDLSQAIDEIIAWRYPQEPYRPEKGETE